jgi:hypothetical protein
MSLALTVSGSCEVFFAPSCKWVVYVAASWHLSCQFETEVKDCIYHSLLLRKMLKLVVKQGTIMCDSCVFTTLANYRYSHLAVITSVKLLLVGVNA